MSRKRFYDSCRRPRICSQRKESNGKKIVAAFFAQFGYTTLNLYRRQGKRGSRSLPFVFPLFPTLSPLCSIYFLPLIFSLASLPLSSRKRTILAQFLSPISFPFLTPLLNQPIRLSNEKAVWAKCRKSVGIIRFLADSQLSRVRLRSSYARMSCRRDAELHCRLFLR